MKAYSFGELVALDSTNPRANPRKLDLAEFWDGREWLNTEVGNLTSVNGQDGEGIFIKDYYENNAQNEMIEFPDELLAFKNCQTTAVMCCWVQDRHGENNRNDGNCRSDDCFDKDPADNTDICYVDMAKSTRHNHVAGGKAIFHDVTVGYDPDVVDSEEEEANDETEGRYVYCFVACFAFCH